MLIHFTKDMVVHNELAGADQTFDAGTLADLPDGVAQRCIDTGAARVATDDDRIDHAAEHAA